MVMEAHISDNKMDKPDHLEEASISKGPEGNSLAAAWDNVELRNRQISRKLDIHLLPLLFTLFILSYIDRGNIGNAKTAGAQKDLGLSSTQWSWVLIAFYIVYTCLEWLVLCWKIFPAHIYVTVCCIGWGTAAMASGAVHSMGGLVACRVIVGVFEAAFGAGVPYFMSLAYKRRELGLRLAILLGTSPVANCISGTLAYGISKIHSSYHPWRLIFIIEGAPTLAIAPIVYFFLADSVKTAKFLTEEEQRFAGERLQTLDSTEKSKLSKPQLFAGLKDYKNYCHALNHFCCNYSFACLSNFLPTIIKNMGYTSIHAQGISAPPYLGAFVICIIVAFVSDRYGQRGYMAAGFAALASVGYAILASQTRTAVRYLGVWFACCGIFPALALNMTWMLNNQAGETKRGIGMSLLAIFGQTSSFVASTVFPNEDAPYYIKGTAIGCGLSGLVVPISLFLHFSLAAENKRRDEAHGKPDLDMQMDISHVGDKHPNFRYLV